MAGEGGRRGVGDTWLYAKGRVGMGIRVATTGAGTCDRLAREAESERRRKGVGGGVKSRGYIALLLPFHRLLTAASPHRDRQQGAEKAKGEESAGRSRDRKWGYERALARDRARMKARSRVDESWRVESCVVAGLLNRAALRAHPPTQGVSTRLPQGFPPPSLARPPARAKVKDFKLTPPLA